MPTPKKPRSAQPSDHVTEQGFAAWINWLNQERQRPLRMALDALTGSLDRQDRAFAEALRELAWAQETIGDPAHILGSDKTKHGEIAEILEVAFRRARDLLAGRTPSAVWNSVDRMAPDDYSIDGVLVQSKFINGINNELQHVLDHASKYSEIWKEKGGIYHVPRDHYETIKRILSGESVGFNDKTVAAIKDKIQHLEQTYGRRFEDLVKPALNDYADVQQGRVTNTLDREKASLREENRAIKEDIKEEHQEDIDRARAKADPSIQELGRTAVTGAAVGGGLQLTIAIYQRWAREGKPPTKFTGEDWREIAGQAISGSLSGGISAAALYGLTNYAFLGAPFAGAVVSSGRATAALVKQYRSGAISLDEFTDLCIVTSAEAGIVAAGAALGQTLIPIPILGAVIGSSIARVVETNARQYLGNQAEALARRLEARFHEGVSQLDSKHQALLAEFTAELLRLGDLTQAAFDFDLNASLLLLNSVRLAEAYGVQRRSLVRSVDDVDTFIYGSAGGRKR